MTPGSLLNRSGQTCERETAGGRQNRMSRIFSAPQFFDHSGSRMTAGLIREIPKTGPPIPFGTDEVLEQSITCGSHALLLMHMRSLK